MQILVTGATGFIGRNLVEKLLAEDHKVRIFTRDRARAESLFGDTVKYYQGDFTDTETLEKALGNCEIVYHLAGKIGAWEVARSTYFTINYNYTKLLLAGSLKKNIKHFIYCSSGGVLGPLKKGVSANESSPLSPSNDYEESKAEAEKYVLSKRKEINITILRPEFVYGEYDLHVLGLFKQFDRIFIPLFDHGNSFLHPTYIKDLINAFLLVLNNPTCFGEIYNISGPEPYTVKELFFIIKKIIGKKVILMSVSARLAFITATILEKLAHLIHFKPPLTVSMVKFFTENRNYSSKKIQALGLELTSLEEGLKQTIDYYRSNDLL